METWDACKRGMIEKSAVAEQAWENRCWTMAEDRSCWWRRPTTSRWQRFNRDGGLEIIGCWAAVMRRQGECSNPCWPLTSNHVYPQQCKAINSNVCLHLFTFPLMTTGPFSQNISKLFSELKISLHLCRSQLRSHWKYREVSQYIIYSLVLSTIVNNNYITTILTIIIILKEPTARLAGTSHAW